MLKKKSLAPAFFWNTTPSSTPELSPTSSDSDSDEDMEPAGSRPVSLAVSAGAFCPMRPTLDDVLANAAPPPYTLSAFMAYLSQNHCLETLEFTLEAKRYRDTFYSLVDRLGEDAVTSDGPESAHLRMLWQRLLVAYILPGAPREINLSSEVRDGLLRYREVLLPPVPETLDSAVKRIHELMEDPEDTINLSSTSLDENPMKRARSRAKRTSPQSSTKDLPGTGPSGRSALSLGAVHALGKRASGALLTTSGESVSVALTDDSSPQSSPTVEEPMTPPTTPPASEPHLPMHSPKLRTENPWKKMGMKLGFKKRSGGASGSRADPKILGLED
ncbi:hypothetical protein N7532_010326 [Penicillium argentinense]|uniref:RGS domain-containing protein n=1 Tax=Penicillium argentinense TaxID=1131581 RepID=A0A9W9EPM3_9EURO|nr:uncharacterized protein N7532_010326 [Penicillium argentinense]KAJ5085555.1 hypothetical protein N7532_010326 [Penicillium argentinense]